MRDMKSPSPGRAPRPGPSKRRHKVTQPREAALVKRLNRIEGQVRGVTRMIAEERYCVDILTQLAAIRSALDGVSLHLLHDHTRGCVASAIRSGKDEPAISELLNVVGQFTR